MIARLKSFKNSLDGLVFTIALHHFLFLHHSVNLRKLRPVSAVWSVTCCHILTWASTHFWESTVFVSNVFNRLQATLACGSLYYRAICCNMCRMWFSSVSLKYIKFPSTKGFSGSKNLSVVSVKLAVRLCAPWGC